VAERKMSLYMVLSCRPIHRGRHVDGLRDADDDGDRRKGQTARRSRTPLFGKISLLNFIGEYSSGLLKRRVEIDLMAEILRLSTRREVDKSEVLARISGDLMNAIGAAYTPFDVAF
jgi:hypothetical protein